MLEKAINNNASILSLCFVYVDFSSYGHVLEAMFTISVVFTFTMSYRVAIHSGLYSPT